MDNDSATKTLPSLQINELISDLIPDIVAQVDLNKTYVWINKAGKEFYGEDVLGKEASYYFVDEQNTYGEVSDLFEGNKDIVYVESWQRRKDGEKRLLGWTCKTLRDTRGKIVGVLSTAHDITNRYESLQKIKTDEAQLNNAMALAHLGAWEYDVAKDEFTFNDTFYKLFHTNVETVGSYVLSSKQYAEKFLYPDDIPLVGEEVKKIIETTDPNYTRELEHRVLFPDKSIGYVNVRFFIIKNSEGKTVKTIGINQDITDLKKSEDEIKHSQMLLQDIIDLLPVRIFWKDKELNYLGCNLAFAKDTGKNNPHELIGKSDFDMSWKDQAELYRKDDMQVISSGISKINYEEEQTTPSGEKIWVMTNKVPLRDVTNEIIGVLGTYNDITQARIANDKLKIALSESKKANDLFINRELKMVELKKEIESLRAQISSK